MTETKSLEQQFREARSSQEISDIGKQQTGWNERVEGSAPRTETGPWTSVTQPGRVRVQSVDGIVDLPVEQLTNALRIDPNLTVIGLGANAELQKQISEITDPSELQRFLEQQNRQQK